MATVTIQITAQGSTVGPIKTVSGPDLIRFLAALRGTFYPDPTFSDAMIISMWANQVLADAKTMTRKYEQHKAEEAAVAAITDISVT